MDYLIPGYFSETRLQSKKHERQKNKIKHISMIVLPSSSPAFFIFGNPKFY